MLQKTGIPTPEDLEPITPPLERLKQGPVAIIECFQNIPCNPCSEACTRGAILPFENINDRPQLDYDRCNGCGTCMTKCPGLAIFIIDMSYSEKEAILKIPYEYLPLPEPEERVTALDRAGRPVGEAIVLKVQQSKAQDRTAVIWLKVAPDQALEIRNIRKIARSDEDDTIICRCEEISQKQIQALIARGLTTIDEIKRISRCGMGPCQGRTCRTLVAEEIARATGTPVGEQPMPTFRPPTKPVKLGILAGGDDDA